MTTNDSDDVLDSPTERVAEHVRSYLETDGENGHLFMGFPTLLLTTRGRRSGKLRRTPLIYGRDGDRYLLVASNAAAPRHPAWYLNVVARPEVAVQVKADTFTAQARTATVEEKRLFWSRMAAIFPQYDIYQRQTDREIPMVILTPVPPTA